MSYTPRSSNLRSWALRPQLAAHTDIANILAGRLFRGEISQKEYDAQTYSTTIVSDDRSISVPIVLSLSDSLANIIAYAHRNFKEPFEKAGTTRLYTLWSEQIFYACGIHAVPENLVLLDSASLNVILSFMKASPQVEQLLVLFDEEEEQVAAKSKSVALPLNKAVAEVPTPAATEEGSKSSDVTDRGSPMEEGNSPSSKDKERESFSPENEQPTSRSDQKREGYSLARDTQESAERYQQILDMLGDEESLRAEKAKHTPARKEPQASKERSQSDTPSGASKGSSNGHPKKEGQCGDHRSGK